MKEIQFYAHETARKSGHKFEYHLRVTNGGGGRGYATRLAVRPPYQSPSGRRAKKSLGNSVWEKENEER